jgi:hypothetical protein
MQVPIDFVTSQSQHYKAILAADLLCRLLGARQALPVEIFFARDSELIEVIVRRKIFHAYRPRTLDPVLEPETSNDTFFRDTGNSKPPPDVVGRTSD